MASSVVSATSLDLHRAGSQSGDQVLGKGRLYFLMSHQTGLTIVFYIQIIMFSESKDFQMCLCFYYKGLETPCFSYFQNLNT